LIVTWRGHVTFRQTASPL